MGGVITHPRDLTVQAVAFDYERKTWKVIDSSITVHLERLSRLALGDVEVASRSLDDRYWIVAYTTDNGPVPFYLYDTQSRDARLLFTNRPALEGLPLVPMHPATITRPMRDASC